jgi:arginyl-tRNA synthetase
MVKEKISKLLNKITKKIIKKEGVRNFKFEKFEIEHPKNKNFGDYSTNLALVLAKHLKKDPMEIGEKIKAQISKAKTDLFEKIEVVKPGFINFFLKKEFLQKKVLEIIKEKKNFGKLKIGKKQKVQVEFISANPTGPIHVGNARSSFFGDLLAKVLERSGYKVEREYFINDGKFNTQIRTLGQTALGRGTAYLTEELKVQIKKLKNKLKKITDEGEAGYLLAQEIQKENKKFIEKKLKIKFDNWVSEQKLYEQKRVEKIFQWLKKKGLTYEKDGAFWIKLSEFGAEKDEVLIKKEGDPSYFLSDIAYHKFKFERNFKKIINIWGADHQGHVKRMKILAKVLGYKGDFEILICQIVTLKGGKKFSKRKGEIITLKQLIDEVGLDVVRFFYLTKSLSTQMEFDLDLAKEQSEKNPVYYIQYAHARICSILKKLKTQNSKLKINAKNLKFLNHPAELELIKQLIKFPEIIEDCAKDYQLQRIPQYALNLASLFHQFYQECKVLTEDKNLMEARLNLILATKIVLKNVLDLMGISAPEKM